jgi:dTDP-4-amino-4,6-dideoxygalactose transaminase
LGARIPKKSTARPLLASGAAIPVARPLLDDDEIAAAARAIRSGWVTQGPEVAAFEREFAEFVGAPFACAVSSGTAALHLALLAAGVGPGDDVVTVSHSFIATANAIRHCGARPVFVDVEPGTFNMDPSLVEPVLGPRTRAILCVHQLGMPCDLASLVALGRRRGIPVIEDAACAAGSEILWGGQWQRIGRPHGSLACFSFHPRKLLTTGDGGMITTANPEWDAALRRLRHHGMSLSDAARHHARQVEFEAYPSLGYNFRLTDIQAAVGREQLKKLPAVVARRRALAGRYRAALSDVPGLSLPESPEWASSNWQSFCVRLPAGADQRRVMQRLLDAGISTRRGVMCAHREGAYPPGTWTCDAAQDSCPCGTNGCRRLRASEEARDRSLILPLYHQMTEAAQDRVVARLREACLHG